MARHNKFGRRYRRHHEKHSAFFEDLARDIVSNKHRVIDLGPVTLDVRLSRFNHWLEVARSDGSSFGRTKVAGCKGDNLVRAIADYLMIEAANYPGVDVPPDTEAERD